MTVCGCREGGWLDASVCLGDGVCSMDNWFEMEAMGWIARDLRPLALCLSLISSPAPYGAGLRYLHSDLRPSFRALTPLLVELPRHLPDNLANTLQRLYIILALFIVCFVGLYVLSDCVQGIDTLSASSIP